MGKGLIRDDVFLWGQKTTYFIWQSIGRGDEFYTERSVRVRNAGFVGNGSCQVTFGAEMTGRCYLSS
jgi:hypothetical protein